MDYISPAVDSIFMVSGLLSEQMGDPEWIGLATDLQQAISNYNQFLRAFEDLATRIQRWFAEHQKELDAFATFLQRLSKVDWREIDKPVHEAELKLADAGWTIPGWMYRRDILELSQKSPAEIDIAITELFMNQEAKNLERLRGGLLKVPALAQWHSLIEDIFSSIKSGHHRVAIPAALSVLEGFIANCLVQRSLMVATETGLIKEFSQINWYETDIHEAYFWQSGITFLYKIFGSSDFSRDEPSLINRHWVLHGRSSKDWTIADALRLLNAISTLHHLFEEIGWPKEIRKNP